MRRPHLITMKGKNHAAEPSEQNYGFFFLAGFRARILRSEATTKQPHHPSTLSFRNSSMIRPTKFRRLGE